MLYCFSQSSYDNDELVTFLSSVTENDAVVLWQDGVLLAIKYPQYFESCEGKCFAIEPDVIARDLTALLPEESKVRLISLMDLVDITEQYFPQVTL
ncbi:hypothetical protein BKK54_06730 [Rodentibacter genomosp. 1]|uniref:Sulfurtransferase TusB n=1 Tax=Rodentibacter genomosp. 1 TaxID=1908264 RepID=A0A1V3J5M1_9PAST|nr:DsrH/TusB family sulfur metabolism protein [Rodentibacter genomosp. 1]OOF50337.1 hypothetical protein BKK54_06730 [Rodentibacter genomosp. 1]